MPCAPVNPWQITRVSAPTRMDMRLLALLLLLSAAPAERRRRPSHRRCAAASKARRDARRAFAIAERRRNARLDTICSLPASRTHRDSGSCLGSGAVATTLRRQPPQGYGGQAQSPAGRPAGLFRAVLSSAARCRNMSAWPGRGRARGVSSIRVASAPAPAAVTAFSAASSLIGVARPCAAPAQPDRGLRRSSRPAVRRDR